MNRLFLKTVVLAMLVLAIAAALAGSYIQQSSPAAANTVCSFTAQTSVTCTHNLNTTAVVVDVYDASTPPLLILPATLAITNANTVTVTFASSTSGKVVVNGSSGSGVGGGTFYQTIQVAGVSRPQEPILNFPSNMTCVDNPGATRTDCTPSGGGGGGNIPQSGWTRFNFAGTGFTYNDFSSSVQAIQAVNNNSTALTGITRALPSSTSYTIIAQVQINVQSIGGGAYIGGVVISDGTKYEDFELLYLAGAGSMPQLRVETWTNSGTPAATLAGPTAQITGSLATLKIVGDATHRTFFYWDNGAYTQFFQEPIGTFLTETAGGISVLSADGLNAAGWTQNNLLSWALTTP